MAFRYLLRWAAVTSALLIVLSRSSAQEVDVKGLHGVSAALFFSKDGRWLREFESRSLTENERYRVHVVTYDVRTGAVVHVLDLSQNSQFLSAKTDGRVAVISFNRDLENAQVYIVRLDVETGRQEKIPAAWFDNDPNPYATISGDGRLIGAYSESGPEETPRVVRLYDWRTKKMIAQQGTGFPAGGFAWGEVTVDRKILFQTNRTGGEVVDPNTGRMLAKVSPNTYRSPDGAWDVDFPNPMYDIDQPTIITDGIAGIIVGKLEGSGGNNTAPWTWGRGTFCGTSGRFIVARAGIVEAFEIPSGKKIAEFPAKIWQDELDSDGDPTPSIGCSSDGNRVAIRSTTRLTIHRLPNEKKLERGRPQEQTEFGSDSDLERPIPVPAAALDALRSALKAAPDELSGDELKASAIHLAGPAETDIIVPSVAAHAAFFYILRPTPSGYKLIFDSGGDTMTILRTRSHGYRDLRVWGFAQAGELQTTVIYKFDGRRYVEFSEKTEHAHP